MSSEIEQFQRIIKKDLLKAPRFFESIVNKSIELNSDTGLSNQYAAILLEHWEKASIYKKRLVAQEISKLNIISKIVLTRQIKSKTGVPFEAFMAKPIGPWNSRRREDKCLVFNRPVSECAMAMGNNKHGRLGIGSDEEMIDDLRRIQIKGQIENVFMGENHTIFLLTNKDIYGCGKAKNFLEGHENSDLIIPTPVKLDYLEGSNVTKVIVTDESTEFHEYSGNRTLIVGTCSPDILKISSGPNWCIVYETEDQKRLLPPPISVKLKNSIGKKVNIKIGADDQHYASTMVVLTDGFRVDGRCVPKNFGVCNNGIVYASIDGIFYKGGLKFAPRDNGVKKRISRSDNKDDDVTVMNHILHPKPDVLIAVLEEYIMPMLIKHFKVNPQGDSFIFYNAMKKPEHVENLSQFRASEKPKNIELPKQKHGETVDGLKLSQKFKEYISNVSTNWSDDLYDFTGRPTEDINEVRVLLILKDFLRVEGSTQLPEVFVKALKDADVFDRRIPDMHLFEKRLKLELDESLTKGTNFPIFILKAGWKNDEKEERLKQIREKVKEFFFPLVDDVIVLLDNLINIPLSHRKYRLDERFCHFVDNIMSITDDRFIRKWKEYRPLEFPLENRNSFKTDFVENAVNEKIKSGEIVKEDPKFKTVRVEGIGRAQKTIQVNYEDKIVIQDYLYCMHTNEIFIRSIDSSLLAEIDENRILNLNKICKNDKTAERFQDLMDSFFLIKNDITSLRGYEKIFDMNSSELPKEEKYKISSIEGSIIEVPKVLFELFSDFDSARRRHAEFSGGDANSFNLSFPENTIKAAMSVLIDARTFFNLDMEVKFDVFHLCRFCLFNHLYKNLLEMIVITAEEKDMDTIQQLFWENYEDMCEIVAKHRPDIILFWRELPFSEDNFWEKLKQISEKMSEYNYTKHRLGRVPAYGKPDGEADGHRIDKVWMRKFLSSGTKDKDVQDQLMRTIYSWDVKGFSRYAAYWDESGKSHSYDFSGTNHIWHEFD